LDTNVSDPKLPKKTLYGSSNQGTPGTIIAYQLYKAVTMKIGSSKDKIHAFSMGLGVAVALSFAGCRVQVDKGSNGQEKTVQVDTPFGGVHVNTDQTSASDLGLPVYPGANIVKDDEKHKSADVHLGFGEWQLRVKAVSYNTPDGRDKVAAFYKKALTRFGDVITCDGNNPVGTPTITHEGLTCAENDKNGKVKLDDHDFNQNFQLKAGSKHHQHIVGFEDSKHGQTRFALIALDLPANLDLNDKKDEDDNKQ